jgi:HEAT repeat protein
MKNIGKKLAAVAFVLCAASPAMAGKNGSSAKIRDAYASGSVDAIVAEVERAEALMCSECVDLVTIMTTDDRLAVREVAAWWFAKRPSLQKEMAKQFTIDLAKGDSVQVRNAADFLGRSSTFTALPALREAIKRDVSAEAKLAMVRAVDYLGNLGGNPVLVTAMADRDATVRARAATAWRDIRGQQDAAPVIALLGDANAEVRAAAATTIGGLTDANGRAMLEQLVVNDPDSSVRHNAAWALGKIGAEASRTALSKAAQDPSGFVSLTAKAALGQLH